MDNLEKFIQFLKADGKPLKLNRAQKQIWEMVQKDPSAKLHLLYPRSSSFIACRRMQSRDRLAAALNEGKE